MKKNTIIFCLIFGIFLIAQTSLAEKAYVTDSIKITFRSGPSIQNKIFTFLSTGQAVEVLETQGNWTHVHLLESDKAEKDGWVMSRYLIKRVPWESEAISLRNENEKLREKLDSIEKERKELKYCAEDYDKLRKQYDSLMKDSEDYLNVKAAYDDAVLKLETARADLQSLDMKYKALTLSQRNKWFAVGALVLLVGLLIGVAVGRQHKKKRSIY